MFNNNSYKLFFTLILVGLVFPLFPLFAFAQDGSAGLPAETPPSATTEPVATPSAVAEPTLRPTGSEASLPAATTATPRAVVPQPTPPAPTLSQAQNTSPTENTSSNLILWAVFVALAILPFGYLAAQSLKNKKTKEDKKDGSQCFDIKKLLDKKLKELTDLRGRLESKAQGVAREKVRESVRGTPTGEMLALVEKAEKEYGRLKKLYEECIVEFGGHIFKGTIIENSLKDKGALDKVKIEKTYQSGDWVLYDVFVNGDQIPELSRSLADGPWYIHLWEPGKDDVKVIFKDKIFNIKFSDKSTWVDALAYGKSIGIPDEQLDFPID